MVWSAGLVGEGGVVLRSGRGTWSLGLVWTSVRGTWSERLSAGDEWRCLKVCWTGKWSDLFSGWR